MRRPNHLGFGIASGEIDQMRWANHPGSGIASGEIDQMQVDSLMRSDGFQSDQIAFVALKQGKEKPRSVRQIGCIVPAAFGMAVNIQRFATNKYTQN